MKLYKDFLIIGLIVLGGLWVWGRDLDKPFYGHHDFNNNIWTLTARNNLSLGIGCTRLGQVTSYNTQIDCNKLQAYMNHPPLISWLLTIVYGIFGWSERAGRILMIGISSATLVGIYFLVRDMWGKKAGLLAAMLMLVNPMMAYYGKGIFHEPLALAGVVWLVFFSIKYLDNAKYKWGFLGATLWVGLSSWPGYLILPCILGYAFLAKKEWKKLLWGLLILGLTFIGHMVYSRLVLGDWVVYGLIKKQIERMNFTGGDWVNRMGERFGNYFSWPLVGMALFGFVVSFREKRMWIWGGFGLLTTFLFMQNVYIHDFLSINWLPFLAIASVGGCAYTRKFLGKYWWILGAILVMAVWFVGQDMRRVLSESKQDQMYYYLSQVLRQKGLDKSYLIESPGFSLAYPVVWNYGYGIKNIGIGSGRMEGFDSKGYDFIVILKGDNVEEGLVRKLESDFKRQEVKVVIDGRYEMVVFLYQVSGVKY